MADQTLIVQEQKLAAVDALAAGDFLGCLIMLITNVPPFDDTVAYADLTEATFDGYARSTAVVWGAAVLLDGEYVSVGSHKVFACTGPTVSEFVTGFAVISAMGNHLRSLTLFDTPVPIADAPDAVLAEPRIVYGQ